MKRLYSLNFLSRFLFLLITPVFFQMFVIGFIWHSIYWGVITAVVLVWAGFILLSPIFGRIGCGWFCFFGTVTEMAGHHASIKTQWKKPNVWLRLLVLTSFFASALFFFFYNTQRGLGHGFDFIPGFLKLNFNTHYKAVWIMDISAALFFGFLLDKKWACKNLCFMGALCSVGAKFSRLIPVVDLSKCTGCGKCEKECMVGLPMMEYIKTNQGLITNSECLNCGKCAAVCPAQAIRLKFVWNRKRYKAALGKEA